MWGCHGPWKPLSQRSVCLPYQKFASHGTSTFFHVYEKRRFPSARRCWQSRMRCECCVRSEQVRWRCHSRTTPPRRHLGRPQPKTRKSSLKSFLRTRPNTSQRFIITIPVCLIVIFHSKSLKMASFINIISNTATVEWITYATTLVPGYVQCSHTDHAVLYDSADRI